MVMPVGRLSWTHALLGGVTAALLWEVTRHVLVWYFSTLSQVNVVYGSLTTSIVVLFSLEIGATLLLLGAQVISEYERVGLQPLPHPANPLQTGGDSRPLTASDPAPSTETRGRARSKRSRKTRRAAPPP
jgi:membrane protein